MVYPEPVLTLEPDAGLFGPTTGEHADAATPGVSARRDTRGEAAPASTPAIWQHSTLSVRSLMENSCLFI